MTRRTRADERAAEIDISPTKLLADIERLTEELGSARTQADEYLQALQRERAEFVNFRRRTAEEREASLGLAAEGLISKVLTLADDFDRAIDARPAEFEGNAWIEGIAAIDRKLRLLLESEGVRPIEARPGTRFDPREHEAVANVPSAEHRDGDIVYEIRRGYRLRDRVIRPALVAVAESDPGAASQPPTDGAGTSGDPSESPRQN